MASWRRNSSIRSWSVRVDWTSTTSSPETRPPTRRYSSPSGNRFVNGIPNGTFPSSRQIRSESAVDAEPPMTCTIGSSGPSGPWDEQKGCGVRERSRASVVGPAGGGPWGPRGGARAASGPCYALVRARGLSGAVSIGGGAAECALVCVELNIDIRRFVVPNLQIPLAARRVSRRSDDSTAEERPNEHADNEPATVEKEGQARGVPDHRDDPARRDHGRIGGRAVHPDLGPDEGARDHAPRDVSRSRLAERGAEQAVVPDDLLLQLHRPVGGRR